LAGGLAGPLCTLRDDCLDLLAHLEANLDFAEEPDVDPLGRAELAEHLARSAATLEALADRLRARDRSEGLPCVVLVGPPNAGKSRLFNALLGQTRAIVSPEAGTTRDYLSAPCHCNGLTVELIDTAGLESAQSTISEKAQAFRAEQAARADLWLVCEALDTPPNPDPSGGPPWLRVWTKADLGPPPSGGPTALVTSAATGAGVEELREAIAEAIRRRPADGDVPASTAARCRESLARGGQGLQSASATISRNGGDELAAIDLRQVIDELGKVVGAIVTDDILDRIFRRFCIGK
jgi:tRNA modification GTPase